MRLQNLKYLLIALIGLGISSYMFYSINDKYIMRYKATIELDVFKIQLKLARELEKLNLTLESMGVFMDNTPDVSREVFQEFTTPFLDELYGVIALAWAPATFQSGSLDEPPSRFPIQFVHPAGNEPILLGKDAYSNDSASSAIDRSIASRKITYFHVLNGPEGTNPRVILKAVLPVFHNPANNLKGIVIGEFMVDSLIAKTLAFELEHLYMNITDAKSPGQLLYSGIPEQFIPGLEETGQIISLNAADRIWEIVITPREPFTSYPHAFESYFVWFLGLATTTLLLFVVRQQDNYSKRLVSEVKMRTAELEESNKLKENLLREIHHRVKNNLQIASSLMNMQKRKVEGEEAKAALEDSQSRILAIALIHQKIYQDKDTKAVNLNEYLNDLTSYQKKLFPAIKYIINCPEILIDLDRAVPLALIISELLINASKHAFPEAGESDRLEIGVSSGEDDMITVLVRDNGVGLGPDFDEKKSEGLGFKIINSLCKQISAQFSFSNNEGATFKLSFVNKS